MVLGKLGSSLHKAVQKLLRSSIVDEKAVKELVKDLQRALLQADVNVHLVMDLTKRIESRSLKDDIAPGVSRREYVVKVVYEEITDILGQKAVPLALKPNISNVYLVVGIQGSGKTTNIVKLAKLLKKEGHSVGIVAADTFRAGAYDQLLQLSEQADVPCFGDPKEKESISVAKKGVKHYQSKKTEIILVDTAGRHKEEKGLIREMKQIAKTVKPDEIILVVDGTLGQQASTQAEAFNAATPIGSIIVTKLDGSARGGGALSAVAATGAPIKYIGTGEKVNDLEKFEPKKFVGQLLGMADFESLLKKVEDAEAMPDKDLAKALLSGKFSLKDMMTQMEAMGNVGSIGKILQMLGLGYKVPEEMQDVATENLEKWKVIMKSMTDDELENPKLIRGSRTQRIARGSGTQPKDIKELLKQYNQSKKFIKQIRKRRGGFRIPGMPGALGDQKLPRGSR
ncbi:MAG: signal recognition particle protein Srp54 [Candidatus Hermodarchaeota archaeon]